MNKTGLRDDATWPPSSWNGGRDQIGIGGRLRRNPHWTLDCREALEDGAHLGSLRIGRPCDHDDVVIAMARLQLPPTHARTVVAWGKKRTAPPEGTDARRFWDEAMDRLTVVLRAKGIVRPPEASVFELLMDLPLMYLAAISGEQLPSGVGEQPEVSPWSVAAE